MLVCAPASSANLGSGFDCLGLALDLPLRLTDEPDHEGFHPLEPTHPSRLAYDRAGGDPRAALFWHSPIPPGRGLGFSGAARVAGAFLAALGEGAGADQRAASRTAFEVAAELEGHPDNAAASSFGGLTVAAGGDVTRVEVTAGLAVVVWSPPTTTSTVSSRATLPERFTLGDLVQAAGGAASMVALLTGGTPVVGDPWRRAAADEVHQPARLAARPDAAAVLTALSEDARVLTTWLSGSGPTVAAAVATGDADAVAAALAGDAGAAEGRVRTLQVSPLGVHHVVTRQIPT